MNEGSAEEKLTRALLQIVKEKNPQNIRQLVDLAAEEIKLPEQEIIERILNLQSQGKLTLRKTPVHVPPRLVDYIKTEEAYWYWIIMILSAATTITVFTIPEELYPIVYIRYVLGSIFILWLPGYSFIRALFPPEQSSKTSKEKLDSVERLALSIGLSLALVPLVGLILNYTPWGIRLTPIVLSLLLVNATFSTVAIMREYQTRRKQ